MSRTNPGCDVRGSRTQFAGGTGSGRERMPQELQPQTECAVRGRHRTSESRSLGSIKHLHCRQGLPSPPLQALILIRIQDSSHRTAPRADFFRSTTLSGGDLACGNTLADYIHLWVSFRRDIKCMPHFYFTLLKSDCYVDGKHLRDRTAANPNRYFHKIK